eukprot:SAG11_NODE_35742_length_265_cov_0.626506_1_plen_42_part_10
MSLMSCGTFVCTASVPPFTRVYLLERVLYSGTSLYAVGDLPG